MAKKGPRQFDQSRHCAAKTRSGHLCLRVKGERTNHHGQGRCWLHGGRSPVKHGHYSTITRPNLRQLMDQIAATTADMLNLEGETLLLKALVVDFVNRFDTANEALINWHASSGSAVQTLLTSNNAGEIKLAIVKLREDVQSRPRQVLEISNVSLLIERIGRTVERIHKMRSENAISMETLRRLMEQMALVVVRHCAPELAGRIEQDWGAIIILEGR